MKKFRIKAVSLLLAASLLSATPVFGDQTTDATVQSYEDRLGYVAGKLEEALGELDRLRNEEANAWEELAQYDRLITLTEQKKALAEEQLGAIEQQIAEKEQEISDASHRIEVQEDAFLKRMASDYMEGNTGFLDILLNAKNLVDFLARIDRIRAIRESDKALIRDLNQSKAELVLAEEALQSAKNLQLETVRDLESAIGDTKSLYAAKEARLVELQSNEADAQALYEYYSQLDRELNAELEKYLAELQKKQQSVYIGGTLAWPLDPTAYYRYSSEFGWRTLNGQPDYHLGLDIACAQNTKILAANGGTVLVSTEHWSYGNYVLIDHGGGMATLYAHMTSRAVSAGETVAAGQVIGYVGNTGNSYGHHLHFEVRENGQVQQPRNYISGPND